MGLDMYLNRKFYVKNWDHMGPERRHQITIKKGGKKSTIPVDKISYITTEEIYWRKSNQIHKWFVDNVQKGKDDCGEYHVEREQLAKLLALINQVLVASKLVPGKVINGYVFDKKGMKPMIEKGKVIEDSSTAKQLLPVAKGCFFGGAEYDQYYYGDLEYTAKELTRILAEPEDFSGDFYYHSSW